MKAHRPWLLAFLLASPVLVSATDPATSPCSASSSDSGFGVEIADLIDKVAKRTGKRFIVDPRVRAIVGGIGLDLAQVDYPKLLAILTVHQFAAYESNGVVKVVPDANARQLPIPVTTEIPSKALDDELVTLLVQAKNLCVAQAVPVLRPLMPQAGHMAAFPQSNSLIISDHAGNARRLVDMIERLDKAAPSGQKCPPAEPPPAKSDK